MFTGNRSERDLKIVAVRCVDKNEPGPSAWEAALALVLRLAASVFASTRRATDAVVVEPVFPP